MQDAGNDSETTEKKTTKAKQAISNPTGSEREIRYREVWSNAHAKNSSAHPQPTPLRLREPPPPPLPNCACRSPIALRRLQLPLHVTQFDLLRPQGRLQQAACLEYMRAEQVPACSPAGGRMDSRGEFNGNGAPQLHPPNSEKLRLERLTDRYVYGSLRLASAFGGNGVLGLGFTNDGGGGRG
ncbi:hypothetical protein FA13DRAFT_1740283 [Coprinellus micaceus]|uniref:Uncharacterized protein n=1 Tax=Coprinellus micaceus TaxID=71717 RepID=A0A4Y7SMN2_COPMI|nr:hypothetical protein FA13DRAFT_1740283 [Coprinellus micaceus]